MGLIVEGEKCPICGGYVFEEDDLVFCPICGAPHHRSCYNALGHCGLEADHGTDKQYQKPDPEMEETPEEKETQNRQNINGAVFGTGAGAAPKRRCNDCGNFYDASEQSCPNCGAPAGPVFTPFGTNIAFDPMGGVGKDEEIDEVKATKVRDFVLVNTQRYLPKFKKLSGKKLFSWNWAAFLLPYQWFFYRKMYFQGVFALIFSVIGELFFNSVVRAPGFTSNAKTYPQLANDLIAFMNTDPTLYYLLIAGFAVTLGIRVFSGMFGDKIYRSHVIGSIKEIEKSDEEAPLLMRKKGGVNILLGLISITVGSYIAPLIFAFL